MPREKEASPQTLASLKRQKRSRRSRILVVLLFIVFGVFLLTVIFFMKPEVKKPKVVGQGIRRPIPSMEREQKPPIPEIGGEMEMREKPPEGGAPEEEEPVVLKPPEPAVMSPERELDEKVVVIGRREMPKAEKISQILVDKGERVVHVTLIGDGKIGNYTSFTLEQPPRLVIDIWNVQKEYPKSIIQVDHPLLKRVRLGKHPEKTRLVFDSARPQVPQFRIQRDENRLVVSFGQTEGLPSKAGRLEENR
jgi:hypothetical protein